MHLHHSAVKLCLMRRNADISFNIRPGFFVSLAMLFVLLPVRWVLCWIVATAVHELCHWLALKVMRIRVFSLTLEPSGAVIGTDTMYPLQEIVCALSGPIGSLSTLLLSKSYPEFALFAIGHCCYNLLPIYPMDGGRALHSVITHLKGTSSAVRFTIITNRITVVILSTISLILAICYKFGLIPILLTLLLFFRMCNSNYTLKRKQTNSTI